MKKNFTRFLAALALLVFLAPPMVGWGQTRDEEVLSTCRFGADYNANNSSYTSTFTVTNGNYTWTVGNGNNNNNGWTNDNGYGQVKFGRKNTASVGYITTDNAYSDAVTKVEITIDAFTSGKINSVKLYTGTSTNSMTEAGSFAVAVGTQTVTLSTPATNLYYKIEFDCASGSGNGLITVSKVEYYHNAGGGGGTPTPTLTLSDSGTGNIGNYATNMAIYRDFTVTQNNLTDDITLSATNGGSFTINDEVVTSIPASSGYSQTEVRWHFTTPAEAGQFTSEITATSSGTSATFTYLGYVYEVHNVNIASMEHGTVTANPTSTFYWELVTLDVTPDEGYELGELTVVDADNNPVTLTNNSFHMPDSDVTVSATFEESSAVTVVDYLDRAFTGVAEDATTYSSWSGKTGASGAIYAGNSAGSNNSIQLRTNGSASGFVSTASAGKVTKVEVEWNTNTSSGRKIRIYGKNSAYSAASDLHSTTTATCGTLIGTIDYGSSIAEISINDDYEYIGVRSDNGALYLNWVKITWSTTPSTDPSITAENVNITYDAEEGNIEYEIVNPVEGASIQALVAEGATITNFLLGEPANGVVPFTCDANATNANKTATVTLNYKNGNETLATKEVTVTQAGNPNALDNISDINVVGNQYHVKGQVVTTNARGFVIGDGTGYVYTYLNAVPTYTVGDLVDISGTTGQYGHIIQFTNTATLTEATETGYDGNPAYTVITEVPDYSEGYHLSDYFQFEGQLTQTGNYYYVAVGESTICMSYPTTAQATTLTSLLNKTVRAKGYFAGISSTTGFTVMMESIEEVTNPTISIDPATAQPFTYIENAGPSNDQMFEVTGTNLTSDDIVATITTGADYFEITDNETYSSSVTVNSGDNILVRMKAGLDLGNYAGALTLTNEGAEDVVVALSGSVTGQTYNIELDDQVEHGTIASDMTSAPAGVTVTLTATPDAGYEFGEWTVLDDGANEIPVTGNQFEMPASDVLVSATFNAKQTYTITTVVTPDSGGTVVTLENAYEGQNVEVEVEAETGFTFSSLVVSKTDDATTTVETTGSLADGYSFTMPNYAVTVTATFISDTYTGSFVLFTEEITEGDYVLVYEGQAMTNTVTSNKFDVTDVTPSGSIITDPSRNIVWHIAPSATTGYWTIKNEKVNKYANSSTATSTNVSLVDTPYDGAKWIASGTDTHDFRPKINEGQSTVRYLRKDARFGAYAASNGGPLTLYKYTILTERTITFNGNGGTYNNETTYTQTVYDGIADNLDVNKFTKEGSAFIGWSTTANGEVEYADGASITVNDDLTLYAQWATSYTAMVDDQIVGGTVKVNDEDIVEVAAGTEMTLTYTAEQGYAFRGWNVYKDEDETTTVTVTDNKFTMPEYDVIVSATFENVATYSLVTNVNQIVSGKHYIIASDYYGDVKVMASQADNNRTTVDAYALWDEVIEETEGIYEFVINGPNTDNYYTIYDVANGGYLYAAGSGSGKNYLRNQATNDENGLWSFSIDNETGAAEVVAQGSNTNNYMRFNNTLFSCYASTSSIQNPVYLFVKDNDNDYEYYGCEVTYAETSIEGSITVGAGSVMTITNNQFNNDDPANLIIEDGGQLIHDNPVSATIQRNITGYGRSNPSGYQFIASPVKDDLNVDETNLTTSGSYDLYIFDQSQPSKEWRNYKANEFTTIGNGVGYLYANTTNITISFSGELKPSDNDVPVTLAYTDGNRCAGWNLIGNPFACKAYIKGATGDIEAFYRMNGNGDGYDAVVGAINPMEGIFVQANDIDQSFYFTRTAPDATPGKGNLNLEIAQVVTNRDARQATDNAIIRFDGGNTLEKFSFSEDNAKLYIPQNGKDYAVVSADTQGEMPVNFKAESNGTYTIAVEPKNVELTYLHLIDNLTGANVDLLANPSYTFEANKGDNANRFRLVFKANADVEDNIVTETFAYYNGSAWVISNTGDATLQVIDMMGRVLRSEQISGNTTVNINEIAGVYMLRLANGENVMVQKVVVR